MSSISSDRIAWGDSDNELAADWNPDVDEESPSSMLPS
jgi:hypothetical protein